MNIFSNLGITELILILLLALLVVGPERLPELARKLGKTLRDLRKAYDNLTSDLGPELASFQETAKELRESVDSVRNIPQDVIGKAVKSAELDETLDELKGVRDTVGKMGQTLTDTKKVVSDPINAAVSTARSALSPGQDLEDASPKDTAGQPPETEVDAEQAKVAQAGTGPEVQEAVDSDRETKQTASEARTAVEATPDAAHAADEDALVEQANE